MFKAIRIFVLLSVLAIVAAGTWRTQTNSVQWKYTLPINLYPINADGSAATEAYVQTLSVDAFKPIEAFMQAQASRYGRDNQASITVRLGPHIRALPPAPPVGGSALAVMVWSLKMRWWSWRQGATSGPGPQVKIYLLYFDPAHTRRLGHSTALQKGLVGRVNVFAAADMARQNNIVIAHEFLHTLGATDKYDLANNQPVFPDGYAEPQRVPLWPQLFAEIMAGSTPLTQGHAELPASLNRVLIGEKTAQEINWLPAAP